MAAAIELKSVAAWRSDIYVAFTEWGTLRHYSRRSIVFSEGDPSTAAYGVKQGIIGTTSISADGREIFNTLRHPGDIFGLSELILQRPRTRNAVVLDTADLVVIQRDRFLELLGARAEIILALLGSAFSRWTTLHHMRTDLAGGSARRRVASALRYLAESRAEAGTVPSNAPLHVTHETIGNLCDLSRQTVTTVLAELEAQGLVELGFRCIRLIGVADLDRLIEAEGSVELSLE
jgi:CRP/FNR family transcriptional regulator, cyclic AMP receptor protein